MCLIYFVVNLTFLFLLHSQTCRGSSSVTNFPLLRLELLGRRSIRALLHVSLTNTCCCQMNVALSPALHALPTPTVISYLLTKNLRALLQTDRSSLMSSNWPHSKRNEKRGGQPSESPPFLNPIILLRHQMFSCRHRLGSGRKPTKLLPSTLTYSDLGHSQSKTAKSVTLVPFCTQRPLCSSSPWRCTGSSPGSVSRPPWAQWRWGHFIPGP